MAAGRGGKQGRRVKRGRWIGAFIFLVFGLLLGALCAWLAVAKPGKIKDDDVKVLVLIFGPIALGLLGAGWWMLRKARPAVARHLRLDLAAAEVRRGQPVDVTLNVDRAPKPGCELELALVCTEHYDVKQRVYNPNGADYDQRVTKTAEVHLDPMPVEPLEGPRRITFTVPPIGPFSYEGDCVSAVWHVRAVERRPRRSDRSVQAPVWVAP